MFRFYLKESKDNGWVHIHNFADHTNHEIVKPNCDTLYSFIFIDLSKGNYKLIVPKINDRYYSYCFLGHNTDVLGYINQSNKHLGNEFILTRKNETFESTLPRIKLNTRLCWIIARFGVREEQELKKVNRLQQEIEIYRED